MNTTSIFVTNLGKYNEGALVGEWLALPADEDDIKACLDRIGINENYEEYFITDYDDYTDFDLYERFGEYSSIERISDFVAEIEDLDADDYKIVAALVGEGYELEEAIEKLTDGSIYTYGGDSMAEVAENMLDDYGELAQIPEHLRDYFDFDAYGTMLETTGHWVAYDGGYIEILD